MGLATTTKEIVIMAEPTISDREPARSDPYADFLTPAEARRSIRTIAWLVHGATLNPAVGIRACLKEAITRASPEDVRIIATAGTFLSELVAALPPKRAKGKSA
jgi:hypothetical protein